MLNTYLTDQLGLRYPIIGAPMAGVAGGTLARAITLAGGLGCIGIGITTPLSYVEEQAAIARGQDNARFGLGLIAWVIEKRPDLFEAALGARPALISISFGAIGPCVERVQAAGILLATQVQTAAAASEAEAAGADLIVAQGTEAGGHSHATGIGTLVALQSVLGAVSTPVVAAGGIASPAGLAAVLAAGAEGGWVGTAFLASPENAHRDEARGRILAAAESETVLTDVFDRAQEFAWPAEHPGRALRNRFAEQWHGRGDELAGNRAVLEAHQQAVRNREYDTAVIYAGQAVGLIRESRPAGDIVRALGDGAEALLRRRYEQIIRD